MMIFEKKAGRHTLYLEAKDIGDDLLIVIYGGDEHHIGGVSAGHVTQSHYREANTVSVSTLTFPGHKDYVVSNQVTEKVCDALCRSVVTTVGIHYDDATREEIKVIITTVDALVDEMISRYQKAE
jgi:hypothetical protein